MRSPTERRDGGDELPREARDLLRKAARPAPPTAAERAAIAAMAARIAAVPLPTSPSGSGSPTSGPGTSGLWSKLAALGAGKGVGIAGLVLAVGGGAWIGAGMLRGAPSGATPPTAPQAVIAGASTSAIEAPPESALGADKAAPVLGADKAVPLPDQASAVGGVTSGNGSPATDGAAGGRARQDGARQSANVGSPAGAGGSPAKNSGRPASGGAGALVEKASSAAKSGILARPVKAISGGAVSAGVAPPTTAPIKPAAKVTGCPAGPAIAGDRASEGPILAAAAKALSGTPLVTLACIQELARIGGPFQLADEQTFLAFEASRRLGREADARRFARALLRVSPGSAYAAKARAYLGDDKGP